MKSPLRPLLLSAAALLAGFRPLAARADIAAPPNDYTGFLFHGGHYFSVLPGNAFGKLDPQLALSLAMGTLVICGVLLLVLLVVASVRTIGRLRGKPGRNGLKWIALGLLIACWGLVAAWELLWTRSPVRDMSGSEWPPMHYLDTPELRGEYDQKCIDWYNAHRGDWPGDHSYIYWRNVPRMRPGAPEAVTNAYEAFRESLGKKNDILQKASDAASDYESSAE